jgi:hypothetical protein
MFDNYSGQWDGVTALLRGYMTDRGVGEREGAENAWHLMLNTVCRMLPCPGPRGVPWWGRSLQMLSRCSSSDVLNRFSPAMPWGT